MGRRPKRRGVLLLIVLSLLVLFLLVGLSFMVSAGQFNRLARSASKTDATGMPGHKLADNAMYQLLRGTGNPYSSLRGHSLLEDLYGRDYLLGTVGSISDQLDGRPTAGQLQTIIFDVTAATTGGEMGLPNRNDYYAGCVLTFLDGPAKGISTRVVTYKPLDRQILVKSVLPAPTSASRFIINGRPHNGTGAGYDTATGVLSQGPAGGPPLAFLPHYSAYGKLPQTQSFQTGVEGFAVGGMDESYDSVDYQNLFLAKAADRNRFAQVSRALYEIEQGNAPSGATPAQLDMLRFYGYTGGSVPSFHRPYLMAHLTSASQLAGYERAVMLRPSPTDHPAFTGSNPGKPGNPRFDPILGPWDVDNDGDGIAESIWVDAGLAPVSAPDGRMYKPLVAIHVQDMDGRVNINAIDSLTRTKSPTTFNPAEAVVPGAVTIQKPDLGLGFGPADISLNSMLASSLPSRYLGRARDGSGDYVERRDDATTVSPWGELSAVGRGGELATDPERDDDLLFDLRQRTAELNQLRLGPNEATATASLLSGQGTPMDLHARAVPYIDPTGNMAWAGHWLGTKEGVDDPYELNLLKRTPYDNPYDLEDLLVLLGVDANKTEIKNETIVNEFDGTLVQDRRALLANQPGVFTTQSFSIPSLPVVGLGSSSTPNARVATGVPRTIGEMFAARMIREGGAGNLNAALTLVERHDLMAPEFERGEKIDLNRVLIPDNDPVRAPVESLRLRVEKERFARHLYNLMMLLTDETATAPPGPGLATPQARREAHTRRIAQWAINVVDFGDADSVMTRLRYDANPFNGEPVRFNPTTGVLSRPSADYREVWGMEHPELVLTETLALHDRRVEDTDQEAGADAAFAADGDDFDSTTKPEGSLFVELLCVRGPQPQPVAGTSVLRTTGKPAEDLNVPGTGLNIDEKIPGSSKPVWRLAISEPTVTGAVPRTPRRVFEEDNPRVLRSFEPREPAADPSDVLENLDLDLDRFIWFTAETPAVPPPLPGMQAEETVSNTYVSSVALPEVRPGQYVLVGPRLTTSIGLDSGLRQRRQRIDLTRAPRGDGGRPLERRNALNAVPVVAQTRNSAAAGCSVSEPLAGVDYYPDLPPQGADLDQIEAYDPPIDTPLDTEPGAPLADLPNRQETDTVEDYRTVFLQRLANPNLPWNSDRNDAAYNPYRTVDWMPVDLSVFNSLDDGSTADPDDPDPQIADLTTIDPNDPLRDGARFESLERSGYPDGPNNQLNQWTRFGLMPRPTTSALVDRGFGMFNVFSAWTSPAARFEDPAFDGPVNDVDNTTLVHTLGWLNRSFVGFHGVPPTSYYRPGGSTVPYVESPRPESDPRSNVRYSTPTLVWHNRPYANAHELMLVPASASSSLTAQFSTSLPPQPVAPGVETLQEARYRGAFRHLLNFSHATSTLDPVASNFHRIFDFVAVPSRFHGTKAWLNQANIPQGAEPFLLDNTSPVMNELRVATVSEFREPGMINLNTFYPELAGLGTPYNNLVQQQDFAQTIGFNSLIASRPTRGSGANLRPDLRYDAWSLFQNSLAGEETIVGDTSFGTRVRGRYPNGNQPAEYPNPLRSSTGSDLIPQTTYTPPQRQAVDATMLRSTPMASGVIEPALAPFEVYPSNDSQQANTRSLQNRKTNAYFRFKDLMKLGNSVTAQSNVFAVWVTVGYFEILPNPGGITATHPDGYQFGAELGSDIGQVNRHRSFYVIDRSVPVAFEPGQNHNVDKAILVRRRLE